MHNKRVSELDKLKPAIIRILKKNGITKASIFGSYARGEAKKTSDIDILILPKSNKFSLLDLIGIEQELKESLNRDVDLLTYGSINPLIRGKVLEEEIQII